MGKRRGGGRKGSKEAAVSSTALHSTSLSLREEASGKKQTHHNAKTMLKLKQFQKLAEWASSGQAASSLGAFFGRRFAEFSEALCVPPQRSLFSCQRCETILQPDINCRIPVEKNRGKKRKRSGKPSQSTQNSVVYTCNFCSHRNLKRTKKYVRDIGPSKVSPPLNPATVNSDGLKKDRVAVNIKSSEVTEASSPAVDSITNSDGQKKDSVAVNTKSSEVTEASSPAVDSVTNSLMGSTSTSLATRATKLLDSKKRIRKKAGPKESTDHESQVSSAPSEVEKASGKSRKRRKSWTSLKEIAESEERKRNERFKTFSIPFKL